MLDTKIITQTNGNGQQDKAQQFTVAFVPTSQETEQLNIADFITRQIERYTDELSFLQAEVKTVTVLLTAYKSWQSQLKSEATK